MDTNHTCYRKIIRCFNRLRLLFSQYLSNDSSVRAEIFYCIHTTLWITILDYFNLKISYREKNADTVNLRIKY